MRRESWPGTLRPYICLLGAGGAELEQQPAAVWAGAQIYWAVGRAVTQGCIALAFLVSMRGVGSPLGDQRSGVPSASQPFIHGDF